jgi:hypothetical protein
MEKPLISQWISGAFQLEKLIAGVGFESTVFGVWGRRVYLTRKGITNLPLQTSLPYSTISIL